MLTNENYFNLENELKYFGSSQFKNFIDCEASALAQIRGEYVREKTDAMLVGSYVDAHFEQILDLFKAQNPSIFTKNGELKANFKLAEDIINRIEKDDMFMKYMSGEKQVIKTGKLFNHDFKIKIDSYHPGKCIVDLKIMKDFEPIWIADRGRLHFIEAWRYDFQAAIYQAIEGNKLPVIIAAATKQKDAIDIELFKIPQQKIDSALKIIEAYIDRFADIKKGIMQPTRCEKCTYCRQTKVLKTIREYEDYQNE